MYNCYLKLSKYLSLLNCSKEYGIFWKIRINKAEPSTYRINWGIRQQVSKIFQLLLLLAYFQTCHILLQTLFSDVFRKLRESLMTGTETQTFKQIHSTLQELTTWIALWIISTEHRFYKAFCISVIQGSNALETGYWKAEEESCFKSVLHSSIQAHNFNSKFSLWGWNAGVVWQFLPALNWMMGLKCTYFFC